MYDSKERLHKLLHENLIHQLPLTPACFSVNTDQNEQTSEGMLLLNTFGDIIYTNFLGEIKEENSSKIIELIKNYQNTTKAEAKDLRFLTIKDRIVKLHISPVTWQEQEVYIVTVNDVTNQILLEKELVLHLAALESAANAVVITDNQGNIQWVNSAFTTLTGYLTDEVNGKNIRFLKSDQHSQSFYEELWKTLIKGEVWQGEIINRRKNGTLYTEEMTITPVCLVPEKTTHYIAIKQDITERVLAADRMRLASKVFENTSEGVLVTDLDGRIKFVNYAFFKISGFREEEVLGKNPRILSSGRHDITFYEKMWTSLRNQGEWQGEIWNRRKNGELYPEWLTISAIKNNYGKVTQYAGVFSDLTARKQDEERIKHLAYHDALTGLPNRFLFTDRLILALAHAKRNHLPLAVMFLDLDRFKYINDSMGHAAGDQLLQEVGNRLLSCVREDDTVARMGGDEFTLLLPGVRNAEYAGKIAQKLLDSLKEPFEIQGRELYVTFSIGIAFYPNDGEDADTLLKNADAALYRAKEQGRNNYQLFTNNMNKIAVERINMEHGLRRALERKEFILHYQPQVDVKTGKVPGVEALIRWESPEYGLVSPLRFIPLAEETGLIIPIGEWVLRTACEQSIKWQSMGVPPLRMSVNLSARQFQDNTLVKVVKSVLNKTGLDPKWLELEITESIAMQDVEFTIETLREFNKMGVHIAIDDFGTGYSSLNYLKKFPISTLKIDRAFIDESTTNYEDAAIVSSILVLAQSLGYKAIAEGVETLEQYKFLKKNNCSEIQGYLFAKPMPSQELIKFLEKGIDLVKFSGIFRTSREA